MLALFWFVFGAGFALLVVAAGVTLHVKRREAWARAPVLDDATIDRIIEEGEIYVDDDDPLDIEAIDDEEERFWSERWDEPSGEW